MEQYLALMRTVLENGYEKSDPQGVGNIMIPAYQMRFDLNNGFPLITTRDMSGCMKGIVGELLWFLSGSTSVKDLHQYGVHFWDQWATKKVCQQMGLPEGELGPIYGKQWRAFTGKEGSEIDQIANVVDLLKTNPDSRRAIVTAWNPADVDSVFVAPCHCFFQFLHYQGNLSLHLFQRSADIPVGIPFNIASYSLLLVMTAMVTKLKPHYFIHTISDGHIYKNQIEQAYEQIERVPLALPTVKVKERDDIFSFLPEDFSLSNYQSHPAIHYPVAL